MDNDLYEEEASPYFSGLLALCGPSSYLLIALLAPIIAYPFYGGETLGRRLLFGVLTFVEPAIVGPRVYGIDRAEYTIGLSGCGDRKTFVVICPDGGDGCFAAGPGRFYGEP